MKTRSLNRSGRRTGVVIGLLALVSLAGVQSVQATVYEVEGETYYAWHNIGGRIIQITTCHAASGGLLAAGLDMPGEWLRVQITLPGSTCYEDLVGFMGYDGDENSVRMTMYGPDSWDVAATSEFTFVGAGTG
ncbi:MAG: hypothetical protein ABIF77_00270 [bacterium]